LRAAQMPFDLQPHLKGDLLELRPLRPEDFPVLYAVAADPLIWEQHPSSDRYQEEVFKAFFREALESGGALIAVDRKDDRIIGSSRFHGYDEAKSEIEIGWTFLARSHWGGAYNREMKRLMLRHAFRFVTSVIFVVGTRNFRSQRAVEKIGGRRAGSRLDANGRENFVYRIKASAIANETARLGLVPYCPAHWLALVAGEEQFAECFGLPAANGLRAFVEYISLPWLAALQTATEADPWVHGFAIVHPESQSVIGSVGFKGPPDAEGMVEIGYGIAPDFQGRGYATEAAMAGVEFAFACDRVRLVRAHTLPTANASTRVLTKCGFQRIGEVVDPEDGPVWRWERSRESA
jgi:RimJ/RimL family protein N-acetyltransferase